MADHHDQGSKLDWKESGDSVPKAPAKERPDDDQAQGQPRGGNELGRELGPGDGDDAPPVTGDEPSPR